MVVVGPVFMMVTTLDPAAFQVKTSSGSAGADDCCSTDRRTGTQCASNSRGSPSTGHCSSRRCMELRSSHDGQNRGSSCNEVMCWV